MTDIDYNDGKIHGWNGGDCPVHPKSVVNFWLRNGTVVNREPAYSLVWPINSKKEHPSDVIAFCVVIPVKEPKTIWVNEYKDYIVTYARAEDARMFAGPCLRIAVKYQEIIE